MDSVRISPSGRQKLQGLTSRSGMPCLPAATGKRPQLPLSAAELFALLGFFAVPAILLLYLMHAHAAFFFRYGIVANFAIATLIPIFLAWLTRGNHTVAWITALALFVWSLPAHILIPAIHPARLSLSIRKPGACEACVLANRIAPALPFVDASGLTFLEMDSREDTRFLSRVYYLTDPSGSMSYAHANIFEGMQAEKDAFPIRAKVEQYRSLSANILHSWYLEPMTILRTGS